MNKKTGQKTTVPIAWDGFIRKMWQRKRIARDLLTCYLPPGYLDVYDPQTLTLVSETLAPQPPHTHAQQMDIVYQLATYDGKGHLLVHIEHQSTRDKMIAWRMRQYDTQLIDRYLHSPEGDGKLAEVFSLVLYNGGAPWHPEQDWEELLPARAMRRLAMQRKGESWKLVDLRRMSDNELDKLHSLSPVLMVLRDLPHTDLADILEPLASRMRNSQLSDEECKPVWDFVFRYGNTKRFAELKQILQTLKQKSEGGNPMSMSVADMLIEEGFGRGKEEGVEEGFGKGVEEGKAEAMRIAATNLLKNGISPEMIIRCTGISQKELNKLIVAVRR